MSGIGWQMPLNSDGTNGNTKASVDGSVVSRKSIVNLIQDMSHKVFSTDSVLNLLKASMPANTQLKN